MKTSYLRKVVERPQPGTWEDDFAAEIIRLREALSELTALEDVAHRVENWDTDSPTSRREILAMQDDCNARKPQAIATARALLAEHDE